MKRIFLLFLLTFLIPVTSVDGFYCTYREISKYKGLASNISTTYSYVENELGVTFSITLVNLNEELYIIDTTNNKRYNYSNNELTISGYSPGQTVKYHVYATNEYCSEDLLYTIRVVLPSYNPYYKDKVCEGAEGYIYCQKWYRHNLDYQQFTARVNAYKLNLQMPVIDPTDDYDKDSLWKVVLDFVIDYYYIILVSIIIICGTIIYISNKKSDIYSR